MTAALWFVLGLVIWIAWGLLWLTRRKLRILKRVGYNLSSADLIQLGKNGDEEIRKLTKDTKIFIVVGVVYFLVAGIIKHFLEKL
ncbi:hypothetical protein [Undibacterium terreum]|uniref:hypothetical protein n=1 Tax=Undibacterium terreum TaxID=1224302 RepID=UPI001667EBAD|nr:hypothetical protein [Undibacterium terreum]